MDDVKDSGKFMVNKYLSVILLHTFCDLWNGIELAGLKENGNCVLMENVVH